MWEIQEIQDRLSPGLVLNLLVFHLWLKLICQLNTQEYFLESVFVEQSFQGNDKVTTLAVTSPNIARRLAMWSNFWSQLHDYSWEEMSK